ncbi:MAG: arsenate reductase ArsC [Alphaproteobacteria bacterium]
MPPPFPPLADHIEGLGDYPIDAVLFCCTMNSVRSVMAETMAKQLFGQKIYFDSAGVRQGSPDYLMIEVMKEIGVDASNHHSKCLDDLEDSSFDLIITLSPEAQHHALEFTRTMACDVEFWNTLDPTTLEGSRDMRLDAYRQIRDQIKAKLQAKLSPLIT